MRRPLEIVVTWDDACARHTEAAWDGTFDTLAKIPGLAPLYHGRQSIGWLTFVNEEALWLASDYDAEEGLVSSFSVIPLGWVTRIRTTKGVVLFPFTRKVSTAGSADVPSSIARVIDAV